MAIYLIKINVALMLLYGFYRLTVSRDTFFGLRRLTLWLIYAVALMVPAIWNIGCAIHQRWRVWRMYMPTRFIPWWL